MDNLTPEQEQVIASKRAEAIAEAGAAYDKLDINGDGNIDREELRAHARDAAGGLPGVPGGAGEEQIDLFFATFDADGNGLVSREEWLTFFGTLFDAVIRKGLED